MVYNILIFISMIFGFFVLIALPFGLYGDAQRNKKIIQNSQNDYLSLYGFQMLLKSYLNLKEDIFLKYINNLDPVVKLFLESENFKINNFSNSQNNIFKKSKIEKKVLELIEKYCNRNYDYPLFWLQPHIISYLIDDIDNLKGRPLTDNQILILKEKFNDIEFKKLYASSISFKDFMNRKLESVNNESDKIVIKQTIKEIEGFEKSFYS